MRKKIVAGNWKMNKNNKETVHLLQEIMAIPKTSNADIMVAPPFPHLAVAVETLKESEISVLAQNMHAAASGAYTGEVSAAMLKSIHVNSVILGHSERRASFNETDTVLAEKVKTAITEDLHVIFCFGEQLSDREGENHFEVVKNQLTIALFDLPVEAWTKITLAYEPVWAIGTGVTASPEQAQEMHAYIRNLIQDAYAVELSDKVTILYGGSVKPNNAKALFSNPDVDGGLIGGASLNAEDFMAIANAC